MNGWRWQVAMAILGALAVAFSGCAAQSDSARAGATNDPSQGNSFGVGATMSGGSGNSVGTGASRRLSPREYVAAADLKDIHFAFDRSEISPEAAQVLDVSAQWLRDNPSHLLLIEGHADERGTNEYNLALGDRRARASMNYLVSHGVKTNRISVISYGEERPTCTSHTEACWEQNRRAHFAVKPQ